MSEADHPDVRVEADGVAVAKQLNVGDFPVPSVVFTVECAIEEPATVHVRDPVPAAVGGNDIGFHPKYGGEHWTFEGDHVAFRRSFQPGEEYTTVYGVADVDPVEWDQAEPAIEVEMEPSADEPAAEPDAAALAATLEAAGEADLRRVREAILEDRPAPASELEAVRTDLEALADGVPSVARVESIEEELTAAGERLEEIDESLEGVTTGQDRNARDIDDLGAEVTELSQTVDRLAAGRPSPDVAERLESIDEMAADLEAAVDFKERIESTLAEFETR